MSLLLTLAILVALLGFMLLLKPQPIWKLFQKDNEAVLSNVLEAALRLLGIGLLAFSVVIAQMV